jgi:hypothetical protein
VRRLAAIGCCAAALAAAGCSLPLPGRTTHATATGPLPTTRTPPMTRATPSTPALVAQANRTHEYPTPVPRQTVLGGWRNPVQAVQEFATTYINWTASTVTVKLRALAMVSVGRARSAMSLAAAQTTGDYELHRSGIANQGVVEAIAPVTGTTDQYAVVTREQTTAADGSAYRGLAPAWHVSLATVARVEGDLWAVSSWQPES